MDAEKFDKVVLDLLYDELDELTRASAIRHMEQSGRAKALYSELRATREVGSLPLVEPPDDLEARILEAEARASAGRPLHQRLGTMVSIIASYAMRPQIGMAAVLLLMVGSSLLLLRVKPGAPESVQVTERGVPESDKEAVAVVPEPQAAVPPRADEPALGHASGRARGEGTPRPSDVPDEKVATREEAKRSSAVGSFAAEPAPAREAPATNGELGNEAPGSLDDTEPQGVGAGLAAGASAGAADKGKDDGADPSKLRDDCEITLPRYEAALARAASPIEASRARWGAAECYARLGRVASARRAYTALLGARAYADRARSALQALPPDPAASATAGPVAAAPSEPPNAAAKPSAPTASAAPKTEP